ncbi:MAG: type II toxin-antitoxin system HicB family antitoxin [Candidatus Pacebacteria bacterium]|nr:type II toxin-antitoxin system HicB family antitoxin [Candidatus Paceibacterota bacterium]
MKNIVQFSISKGKDGYYIAEAQDFPIFTQAETLDKLISNIQEAVELHFSDENLQEHGYTSKPSLLVNFEIPNYA